MTIWQSLTPAEDELVWAMRAEDVAFDKIAARIRKQRRAHRTSEAFGAAIEARAKAVSDSWSARACSRCKAPFRTREDFRWCLPCRGAA